MKLLLDTHAFLWGIARPEALSEKAKFSILDKRNDIYLSIASLWEIAIKVSLNKLQLSEHWVEEIDQEMRNNGFHWLPIEKGHTIKTAQLPFHHKDPFDRLLIAQALVEKMDILSNDAHLSQYEANTIW